MAAITERAQRLWHKARCCPPPPAVTGITAQSGGGSGEVEVTWDPLPASANIAFYRVYERRNLGQWWHLAVVTEEALGALAPGRLGIIDAPDYWPWPTIGTGDGPRCFVVTAVSKRGLEGPMSAQACGSPP